MSENRCVLTWESVGTKEWKASCWGNTSDEDEDEDDEDDEGDKDEDEDNDDDAIGKPFPSGWGKEEDGRQKLILRFIVCSPLDLLRRAGWTGLVGVMTDVRADDDLVDGVE
jgi:hypothetical protein